MTIKKTTDGFDLASKAAGRDYHIRKEKNEWILDAFKSKVPTATEAHIESTAWRTLDQALAAALAEDDDARRLNPT